MRIDTTVDVNVDGAPAMGGGLGPAYGAAYGAASHEALPPVQPDEVPARASFARAAANRFTALVEEQSEGADSNEREDDVGGTTKGIAPNKADAPRSRRGRGSRSVAGTVFHRQLQVRMSSLAAHSVRFAVAYLCPLGSQAGGGSNQSGSWHPGDFDALLRAVRFDKVEELRTLARQWHIDPDTSFTAVWEAVVLAVVYALTAQRPDWLDGAARLLLATYLRRLPLMITATPSGPGWTTWLHAGEPLLTRLGLNA